jgi:hypothetical protein
MDAVTKSINFQPPPGIEPWSASRYTDHAVQAPINLFSSLCQWCITNSFTELPIELWCCETRIFLRINVLREHKHHIELLSFRSPTLKLARAVSSHHQVPADTVSTSRVLWRISRRAETRLRAGWPGFSSLRGQWWDTFSLHHCVQIGFMAHAASYPMGTRGSSPGCKAAGTWSYTSTAPIRLQCVMLN